MNRLWLIPICFVALLAPVAVLAGSGEGGFDGVIHSIESKYHVRAERIPFMGLVSLISRKATHKGASGLHIAEFEHFTEPIDGDDLNRMVQEKLGAGWERMIRETRHSGRDTTLIFIHPEGERMGLFILDADGSEMDVVQVSVDPDHLSESIGQHRHHHSDAGQDGDGGDRAVSD